MANFVGLTVARNSMAEFPIREQGMLAAPRQMVMYGSSETHSSNQKAAELLGIGNVGYRKIPVNDRFEIDVAALEAAIATDKAAGLYPFCVIGNVGTVNTGAIDDLNALADICERERLWFHVDGAFGALAILVPEYQEQLRAINRADSMAFDLHKWMFMPIEVGCVLVKDETKHRYAFSLTPEYLAHAERGIAAGKTWFSEYGLQLSREFRALKVWMSIKTHGLKTYEQVIQKNIEQARYFHQLVEATPELELMAPTSLNIVSFRYLKPGLDEAALDRFNEELLWDLQESGVAVPTSTILNGRVAMRIAITNHRSRFEDFDVLLQNLLELGRQRNS